MARYSDYSTNGTVRVSSDDGEHVIGAIKDGIYTKSNWQSRKHLCHKHKAIGVDKGAFQDYIEPHARSIEVLDRDSSITYQVSVEGFRRYCIEDDLGWGPQLFCPLKHFQKADDDPNAPRQLSLALEVGVGN